MFQRYLLSNVYRSPDDPGAAPADPVVVEPVVAIADPAEPVIAEPAHEPKPQMVPLGVVNGLHARTRVLEDRATAAERKAAEAMAIVERMSRGEAIDPASVAPTRPTAPSANESDVRQAAEFMLFQRDVNDLRDRGVAQYGLVPFSNVVNAFNAVCGDSNQFVSDILAVGGEKGHVLLHDLAQDMEKVANLSAMSPAKRVAELTRMAMSAEAKPTDPKTPVVEPRTLPKTVSRAPAPPPQVDPSTTKVVDWRDDKASDSDFSAGWEENQKRRSSYRR